MRKRRRDNDCIFHLLRNENDTKQASSRRLVIKCATRSYPFISMGLSRVSEGPSTDDVIDVGRLMPYWACIWVKRPSTGRTLCSSLLASPLPPRTVNGHVVESIIEWPSFASSSVFGSSNERTFHVRSFMYIRINKRYTYTRVIKAKNSMLFDISQGSTRPKTTIENELPITQKCD